MRGITRPFGALGLFLFSGLGIAEIESEAKNATSSGPNIQQLTLRVHELNDEKVSLDKELAEAVASQDFKRAADLKERAQSVTSLLVEAQKQRGAEQRKTIGKNAFPSKNAAIEKSLAAGVTYMQKPLAEWQERIDVAVQVIGTIITTAVLAGSKGLAAKMYHHDDEFGILVNPGLGSEHVYSLGHGVTNHLTKEQLHAIEIEMAQVMYRADRRFTGSEPTREFEVVFNPPINLISSEDIQATL